MSRGGNAASQLGAANRRDTIPAMDPADRTFGPLESRVSAALDAIAAFNRSRDDAWAVPPQSGAFLHATILAGGCTRALELGTSYGYSGVWIASALRRTGGRLTTIDRVADKSRQARVHYELAGVSELIDARVGEVAPVIDALTGPFDFVFVDADKPASLDYVRRVWPKLTPRAIVVTDNILGPNKYDWREYLSFMRAGGAFYSTLVPVGNGMEVSVLLPQG